MTVLFPKKKKMHYLVAKDYYFCKAFIQQPKFHIILRFLTLNLIDFSFQNLAHTRRQRIHKNRFRLEFELLHNIHLLHEVEPLNAVSILLRCCITQEFCHLQVASQQKLNAIDQGVSQSHQIWSILIILSYHLEKHGFSIPIQSESWQKLSSIQVL